MYRDLKKLNSDSRIITVVEDFANVAFNRIQDINANELLEKNGINPLLIWALGINDFESLAKFSVYQRLGRSFVTSFGQKVIEEIVRGAMEGEKGEWWDSIKKTQKENMYVCIKSGPQTMDVDQVETFCRKAKEAMGKDEKAVPIIGMCYGRKEWPIIRGILKKHNLNPDRHAFFGRSLFDRISKDPNYHKKLPNLIQRAANNTVSERKLIELMDNKVIEITKYFADNYNTIGELLQYVFKPPSDNNSISLNLKH